MLVGEVCHRPGEMRIPLRPILAFQKRIGAFQGRYLRQSQMLHQTILGGYKSCVQSALWLAANKPESNRFPVPVSARPSCVSRSAWRCASRLSRARAGHREHRIAIRVDIHHPPVLLQVLPQHAHVVRGRIAAPRSVPNSSWSHRRSSAPDSAPAPVLPASRAPRCPIAPVRQSHSAADASMHLLHSLRLALPQSGFDHPLPRRSRRSPRSHAAWPTVGWRMSARNHASPAA